jgi:hypothetical protein
MSSSRFLVAGLLIAAFAGSAGCSVGSGDSSKDAIGSYDSDLKLTDVLYRGTIAPNETKNEHYSTPPTYRAFGFDAKGGEEITLDVRSVNGDAVAFLTDADYEVLASNDDAAPNTYDSRVVYKVPDGRAAKSYRVVFRDYGLVEATFKVTLMIRTPNSGKCNPANEPRKHYKGTPDQCPYISYTCSTTQVPFSNDCGCGCEDL